MLVVAKNGAPKFRKLAESFYLARLRPPQLKGPATDSDISAAPPDFPAASKLAAVLAPGVAESLGLPRVLPREEDKPQPPPQITSQKPAASMPSQQLTHQYMQQSTGPMLPSGVPGEKRTPRSCRS
jgi:hypothetical protein